MDRQGLQKNVRGHLSYSETKPGNRQSVDSRVQTPHEERSTANNIGDDILDHYVVSAW